MLIRPGLLSDSEKLCALTIQVWLHTYATEGISSTISNYVLSEFTVEHFQALLTNTTSSVFVAEINEMLVGYAVVSFDRACPEPTPAKAELATLYVQEPFIGKGVGSSLLTQAETWAKARVGSPLWLTVNSRNDRAIRFYQQRGYTKVGITYFKLGSVKHENLVLANQDVASPQIQKNIPGNYALSPSAQHESPH